MSTMLARSFARARWRSTPASVIVRRSALPTVPCLPNRHCQFASIAHLPTSSGDAALFALPATSPEAAQDEHVPEAELETFYHALMQLSDFNSVVSPPKLEQGGSVQRLVQELGITTELGNCLEVADAIIDKMPHLTSMSATFQQDLGVLCLSLHEQGHVAQIQAITKQFAALHQQTPITLLEPIMKDLHQSKDSASTMEWMQFAEEASVKLSPESHHYIVQTIIKQPEGVIKAQSYLEKLEQQSIRPTSSTYGLVIFNLLQHHNPHSRLDAWNLFAHMRMVSHPKPPVELYEIMLHACATPTQPAIERAMDFVAEITQAKLSLTRNCYNSLIRCFSRSNNQWGYNEALRYFKMMIGNQLAPDRNSLLAILEGAARFGDIARAVSILSIMSTADNPDSRPDSAVITKVLRSFASHKLSAQATPPLPPQNQQKEKSSTLSATLSKHEKALRRQAQASQEWPLPTSKISLVQQATEILARCIGERIRSPELKSITPSNTKLPSQPSPPQITATADMLNAYLMVLAAHAPFADFVKAWTSVFSLYDDVRPNLNTYGVVMDRCLKASSQSGLKQAEQTFEEFKLLQLDEQKMDGVKVARVWVAYINTLAKWFKLTKAMITLREFEATYPADKIIASVTRSKTVFSRKATLSSVLYPETYESRVQPPSLLWNDLRPLHARLVGEERRSEVVELGMVCQTYVKAKKQANSILLENPIHKSKTKVLRLEDRRD